MTQNLDPLVLELLELTAGYRLLGDHCPDLLARHAPDGSYRYASAAAKALTGHTPCELVGTSPFDLIADEDRLHVEDAHRRAVEQEPAATAAFRSRRSDGAPRWLETTFRAVRDGAGDVIELVSVTRDISERKQAELELSHAALHDILTGLPNRALFHDRLSLALLRAQRRPGAIGVLFCDVDRFKVINDSFGHEAGDRLLVDVAARMSSALRPSDTVARFGGDEFTILCEDIADDVEAATIAQRLVDAFAEPFVLDDVEVFLNVSVGIAIAADAADASEDLIRDADSAMYRAKERGKGRYELFDEEMRADAAQRLQTESALRRALGRGELRLHYQPQVDLARRRIAGFEALVRWQHPTHGLLSAEDFLPLAEETGLIVSIGEWMLREACADARRWQSNGSGPLSLSVNISARQLAQPGLVDTVRRVLSETATDPALLCLEITESAIMEPGGATAAQLRALASLGVRIAIDDFGTGSSSLVHLRRFPVDLLKVDRAFVEGLGGDPRDASIVAAIISLAHALGLSTVADGVQTSDQLRALEQLGCDLGQGSLFAEAQSPAEAAALLAQPRPAAAEPSPGLGERPR